MDGTEAGRFVVLEMLTRRWWLFVLRGVVATLFGIFAIVWPGATVLVLVILWGAYALVDGAVALGLAAAARGAPRQPRMVFGLLGATGVIAGLIALVWPDVTALALLWIIAVWALIVGVAQVATAIRMRDVISNEWFLGLSGLLTVVLGVILLVQPAEGAVALVTVIGVFAILWGASLVSFGLRLRRLASAQEAVR
jgi:uncharacterized membrane protein HdeD (DUF308 family)